jgi:hypothetical protein
MHIGRNTLLASGVFFCLAAPLAAQPPRIEAEAFWGEPFGVAKVVVDLPPQLLPEPLGVEGLGVSEKDGRALYPALHNPAIPGLVKGLLAADSPLTSGGPVREEVGGILRGVFNRPPRTTIYFLFRGDGPLELSIEARQSLRLKVQPRRVPALHRLLLQAWWRQYAAPRRLLQQKPDYPPVLENFLVTTLARRLNLQLPPDKQLTSGYAQFERELGLLVGTESVRLGLEQDRALGMTNFGLPADRPLPPPVPAPPLELPDPPADVKIEPIAMHVPEEFFYARFGSFSNFLWMQDTLDTWGGDLQNLVAMRSLDQGRSEHIEKQIVLSQGKLARVLGPAVVADVAIVGTDLLFQDGAAYGILFQARNNLMMASDINGQRADRLKQGGVKEEKVKIEGQEVSYLYSPDGSVRSYYVVSGDYHFVTTSRTLARRFLQVAEGKGSLGASKEFRHARTLMPLGRDDTVFVYFSDAFFRNLTSPRYRVEMVRRLESAADIELVVLAKLNAATEGKPGATIDDLISGGLLPRDFGPRPDGSRAVLGQGEVHDSMRGWRGTFLPAPDMPEDQITAAEQTAYERFAEFYRKQWGRIEPILIGLKRTGLPENRDRVVLDVRMTPLCRQRVQMLELFAGQADKSRLAPVPGNLAAFDAVLKGQRLFGGLRDMLPPTQIRDFRLLPWRMIRDTIIGYLGYVGDPGLLAVLDVLMPVPDANGYSRNPLGLWRRQLDRFTLYSFQGDVLADVSNQLRFEPAARPGQLWLHVGDPTHARMTPFLNGMLYGRTRETALGNVRLLHAMNQQLHVPPKTCREAVEFVMDAKLVCPLGGKYVLRDVQGGVERWTSTVLEKSAPQAGLVLQAPAGYVAPPLSWFRGLDLDAAWVENVLSAHGEVLMQLPPGAKK